MVDAGAVSRVESVAEEVYSALSRQVKALEDEWGWRLFERSGRGVVPTCQGTVALREVRRMLKAVDAGG